MTPGKRPKYKQIADALRTAIDAGEYGPGDRLPGVFALMDQFNVAKMTVQQALNTLQAEGRVELRKGVGAFVADTFAPIRRRGIQRLDRDRWGSGASIWSTDESRELVVDQLVVDQDVAAPPAIASVLELEKGETVCLRSRRFVVAGRPVLLSRSYLPQSLIAGSAITQPDTGAGGTYARLAELGHAPARFREELRGRTATEDEAQRLTLPAGAPVFQLVRTAWTDARRPVEVNEMVLDCSVYVLEYEFDA